MPAPKAVLRDIHDQGLSHKKAHTRIGTNGRLAGGSDADDVVIERVPVAHTKSEKSEAKKVAEVPAPALKVTEEKLEQVVEVEPTVQETSAPEVIEPAVEETPEQIVEETTSAPEELESSSDTEEIVVLASSKKNKGKNKKD